MGNMASMVEVTQLGLHWKRGQLRQRWRVVVGASDQRSRVVARSRWRGPLLSSSETWSSLVFLWVNQRSLALACHRKRGSRRWYMVVALSSTEGEISKAFVDGISPESKKLRRRRGYCCRRVPVLVVGDSPSEAVRGPRMKRDHE